MIFFFKLIFFINIFFVDFRDSSPRKVFILTGNTSTEKGLARLLVQEF